VEKAFCRVAALTQPIEHVSRELELELDGEEFECVREVEGDSTLVGARDESPPVDAVCVRSDDERRIRNPAQWRRCPTETLRAGQKQLIGEARRKRLDRAHRHAVGTVPDLVVVATRS
jgi:hypothetical protein